MYLPYYNIIQLLYLIKTVAFETAGPHISYLVSVYASLERKRTLVV